MKNVSEQGNAILIVLTALVVVGVGALAYLAGQKAGEGQGTAQVAQSQKKNESGLVIEPGNPVVAKVNGTDLTRVDVFNYIQSLPAQMQQMPPEQIYPIALEQVINGKLIAEKVAAADMDANKDVKERMKIAEEQLKKQLDLQKEAAKAEISRAVYLQQQVKEALSEDRFKAAYQNYIDGFPKDLEEVKAAHILVEDEALAKDLLKQIKDGADFAEIAKNNSKDNTAETGGELNYVLKSDVVPEFGEVIFANDPGALVDKVVKTQFGYHIIKVLDKRARQPLSYEEAKPLLEPQLRQIVLDETIQSWRSAANIERFDINGKPIEPAAGEEAAESEKAN